MSRSTVTVGIAIAVAVSFLFVGVGAVAAHDGGTDIGGSGHCSDEAGNGGGAAIGVSVSQSPSQDDVNAADPAEIQSLLAGLQEFGEEKQAHPDRPDTCDGGDGEDSYDYIEVHAGAQGQGLQFCYSEDNSAGSPPGGIGQGDQCH